MNVDVIQAVRVLLESLGALRVTQVRDMGRSRYLTYQCDLCPYRSGRKGNMIRHNKSVHNENGAISIVNISNRNNQLHASTNPAHITFFDSPRTNRGVLSRSTQTADTSAQEGTDPIQSALRELESLTSERERFYKIMGLSPNHRTFPQTVPVGWTLPSPTTNGIPPASMEPVRFVPLGYRGYICDKCYSYGIVDFGITIRESKPTSIYCGSWSHLCSGQAKFADHKGQVNSVGDQLNNQLYNALVKSRKDDLYLFAKEITNESFPAMEELNPVDFGQIKPGDTLYSIIKDEPVKVGKQPIFDFFCKALATYCLASIEDGGKKRLFFLIIWPKQSSRNS